MQKKLKLEMLAPNYHHHNHYLIDVVEEDHTVDVIDGMTAEADAHYEADHLKKHLIK
jgi:hypothetical protein